MSPKTTVAKKTVDVPVAAAEKPTKHANPKLQTVNTDVQPPSKIAIRAPHLKMQSVGEMGPQSVLEKIDTRRSATYGRRQHEAALHAIRWQLERLHENVTAVLLYHQLKSLSNRQSKIDGGSVMQAPRPMRSVSQSKQ